MNKKSLTETDIRSKFITPAITGKDGEKWDLMTQIREEAYFTKGRVIVRGKTVQRGAAKKADYLLYYKPNFLLAVVEAKDNIAKNPNRGDNPEIVCSQSHVCPPRNVRALLQDRRLSVRVRRSRVFRYCRFSKNQRHFCHRESRM